MHFADEREHVVQATAEPFNLHDQRRVREVGEVGSTRAVEFLLCELDAGSLSLGKGQLRFGMHSTYHLRSSRADGN